MTTPMDFTKKLQINLYLLWGNKDQTANVKAAPQDKSL